MTIEIKVYIEKIENGVIVEINDFKRYFFKNTNGIGKYLQDEIEKMFSGGDE